MRNLSENEEEKGDATKMPKARKPRVINDVLE
jgi:hypothetical protein